MGGSAVTAQRKQLLEWVERASMLSFSASSQACWKSFIGTDPTWRPYSGSLTEIIQVRRGAGGAGHCVVFHSTFGLLYYLQRHLFNGLGYTSPSFLHCFFWFWQVVLCLFAASKLHFIHCSSH